MLGRRPLPVYLFTGFLDGGKTSFIRQTMDEGQFKDGLTTLYVICEEGEESIDIIRLGESRFEVRKIEDEESVSEDLFRGFEKEVRPARVIIEANGMWDINELLDALPANWQLAEVITTVDSGSFEMYLNNMKMMMTNQFLYSDLVVFNRCEEQHDRAMFKRMVRAVNRRAQVLYETPDGEVEDNVPEELPYDINADVINIGDEDYGIFYIDVFENLANYIDKTVCFKAKAAHPKDVKVDKMFVVARPAMTCCAEDIAFVGFPCEYADNASIKNDEWVEVTAKVRAVMNRQTNEPSPIMIAQAVVPTAAPEEEIAYFM
ncbi:MAG: hypothetical protein K6G58_11130 [Lachnospiraceae bacterium]|nr:hypothetical protein [Lachnospiraceae bacterium]